MKTFYIYIHNDIFAITAHEGSIPPAKIAAKVSLTDERIDELMRMEWLENNVDFTDPGPGKAQQFRAAFGGWDK
jgi:hypothetical protein